MRRRAVIVIAVVVVIAATGRAATLFFEHERVGIEWTRIHAQESYRDSSRSTTDYARDNYAGEDV